MAHDLHQCPAIRKLGIDCLNQAHGDFAPVSHACKQCPMVDSAGLDWRRCDGRIGVTLIADGLQADQQVARSAQAHDLLTPIRCVSADLDHAIGQGIQVRTRLSLHEQDLVFTEFDIVSAVVDHALDVVKRTATIFAIHMKVFPTVLVANPCPLVDSR